MRVIYIDIDSLRPDHLGCYGYHRKTSPNIDAIAQEGVRFTNYYTSDAPCLPSRTAMMSGMHGIRTGVVGHGGTAADMRVQGESRRFRCSLDQHCLPRVFRNAGMHTALFSPFGERHTIYTFYAGFNEIHNTGKGGMESAEEVTPGVLKWIDDHGADDDWFVYLNYWDPHTPYRAPAEFGNPFEGEPLPEWLTEETLAEHVKMPGPHTAYDYAMYDDAESPRFPRQPGKAVDMDGLRKAIDGYDCGVAYADQNVGMILDALRAKGIYDDVAVIISADHGENLGELGIYGEHGTADHITCRVPLIVKWPGCEAGHVDEDLHYNVDLAPTFADLMGQPSHDIWDGKSFAPVVTESESAGRGYLVLSQQCHVSQRSVRFDKWLYMRTYHCGYHLFPRDMLFDIEADPHEQNDLAEQRRDVMLQGVYLLNEWHENMMRTMPYGYCEDPMWRVLDEGGPEHTRTDLVKYCARLEATGRGDAVPKLKERYPDKFPAK